MGTDPRREYLKVRVETASREDLLLLLLDGLVRFVDGAREAMAAGDRERKHALLSRAQAIVLELACTLETGIGEPLLSNLRGLYFFAHRRLVAANNRDDEGALEEARQIIDHVKETWRSAIEKCRRERAGEERATAGSLSVQG
ncbi:MAG: flagellar export chaperone FliS [Planctomycetes bacterium]|nr:flagellar export chaperone FliS [Planctomycetota bacterium]